MGGDLRRFEARKALGSALALGLLALAGAGCAAPEGLVRRMDDSHAIVCRNLGDAVDSMDRVFGEPRVEDRERIAKLRVGAQIEIRENHDPAYTLPLSLRVPLPALERRANIYLQLDSVADASKNLSQAGQSFDDNKTVTATIMTRVAESLETGARLDLYWEAGPQTGVRPFVRWERRPDRTRLFLEQQVYYLTDLGFGEKTILGVDRILDERAFVRLMTSLDGNEGTPGATVEHALIYRWSLAPQPAVLSAEVGAAYNSHDGDPESGRRGAEHDPDEARLRLRVIGKLFRPWIEYEISPALHQPWRHDDTLEYSITFALRLISERALTGKAP